MAKVQGDLDCFLLFFIICVRTTRYLLFVLDSLVAYTLAKIRAAMASGLSRYPHGPKQPAVNLTPRTTNSDLISVCYAAPQRTARVPCLMLISSGFSPRVTLVAFRTLALVTQHAVLAPLFSLLSASRCFSR